MEENAMVDMMADHTQVAGIVSMKSKKPQQSSNI